jgi:hypothetical protein
VCLKVVFERGFEVIRAEKVRGCERERERERERLSGLFRRGVV